MFEIANLEELIQSNLVNRKFLGYTTKPLLSPGENVNSLLLSVLIRVKDRNTHEEELISAVAKMPPSNEKLKKQFQKTFIHEINIYNFVFPEINCFQNESTNYLPKFLGARLTLDENKEMDDNAVLLLENLMTKKFLVESRNIGFNLEATKLILQNLANLHASVIALKLNKPDIFHKKLKPFLENKPPDINQDFLEILEENLQDKQHFSKIQKIIGESSEKSDLFSTICHNNLWVNNILIKYDNKIPLEIKFVDFHLCRYDSAIADLIFFLLTSVQDKILKKKFDFFLEFYHEKLVAILEKFNCEITEFNWEIFQMELLSVKNFQLAHVLGMLPTIFVDKVKTVELKNIGFEDEPKKNVSPRQREKLNFIVALYHERGWFN